ncbi:MAG: SRPBCC domain-containing protein [Lewinella sp.]|nr:SRPBCC domain-containing protein [Lewinella sp.]
MLHLQTTIDLPARVWDVLTDFAAYLQWNPFITFADGDWAVDNTVAVLVGGMPLEPKVLAFDPGRELRWKGTLLFNIVFGGEHYFLLTDNGDGTTRLAHGEYFSGLLAIVFRRKLETDIKAGFEEMNEALRQRLG